MSNAERSTTPGGPGTSPADRRRHERHEADAYAEVIVIDPLTRRAVGHFSAQVRDVSAKGLRLAVSAPPGRDAGLLIRLGGLGGVPIALVYAEHRHSTDNFEAWNFIGVEIQPPPPDLAARGWDACVREAAEHAARGA